MSDGFRNLLVGLLPEESPQQAPGPALTYAVQLARRFSAFLTIEVFAPPLAQVATGLLADLPLQLSADEEARIDALVRATGEAARQTAYRAGVNCRVERPSLPFAELTQHFGLEARLHDLILLDVAGSLLNARRHIVNEALLKSGRPVVVVPPAGGNPAADRILVAWDGSPGAARAVGDALPLLQAARTVRIASVTGEKDLPPLALGEALLPFLRRHGVDADAACVPATAGGVAATLRREAERSAAELLVMGAFVHSPLRESLVGGITRSLLESCPVPLFLAH